MPIGTISRLPIEDGDRCVLIPLVPQEELKKDFAAYKKAGVPYFNGEIQKFFFPFSFPILGECGEHETIDKIEEDYNTECIERFFGCPINVFVDFVVNDIDVSFKIKKEKKELLKSLSGMYERLEVYQALLDRNRRSNSFFKKGDLGASFLQLAGFQPCDLSNYEEEKKSYQYPGIDGYIVCAEGCSSIIIDKNTKEEYRHFYSPEQFLLKWKELTGVEINLGSYADLATSRYDLLYDEAANLIKNGKGSRKIISSNMLNFRVHDEFYCMTRYAEYFEDLYLKGIVDNEAVIKKGMLDMFHLNAELVKLNCPYFPGWNLFYYDSESLSARGNLLRVTIDILKRIRKEYESDD